jgi:CBS-domain-containing membrane protein
MATNIPTFGEKIKGEKRRSGLAYPTTADILVSGLGGFLIISILWLFHTEWNVLSCFIVPFGASAVLVYSAPAAPFSQPRNVIGGHVFSALVGVAIFAIFGLVTWWTLALANGLAILLMVSTKTVHPPAGATAFLPLLTGISDFTWILLPVLSGAVIIVIVGLLYNNIWVKRRYPNFWW